MKVFVPYDTTRETAPAVAASVAERLATDNRLRANIEHRAGQPAGIRSDREAPGDLPRRP